MTTSIDLLISSLRRGGAERMCTVLANQFAKQGYAVRVVVMDAVAGPLQTDLSPDIVVKSLGVRRARYAALSLYSYLCQEPAGHVLIFNHQLLAILILLRPFVRKFPCLILRNISTLTKKLAAETSFWHGPIVHAIARITIARADYVIAQSENMARDLIENYSVKPSRIAVIHNGVAPQIWAKRREMRKGCAHFRIAFVGRLHAVKDLPLLLDAFARLKSDLPEASLSIYGDGPEEASLRRQAANLGVEASVHFAGQVADVTNCYLHADVTVLTSLYEGFPNCLIESIVLGTPIVSVDCQSGPSDIVEPGQNGYLVKTRDPQDFADALSDASVKPWNHELIRENAEKFAPDLVVRSYEKVIFSLSGVLNENNF